MEYFNYTNFMMDSLSNYVDKDKTFMLAFFTSMLQSITEQDTENDNFDISDESFKLKSFFQIYLILENHLSGH